VPGCRRAWRRLQERQLVRTAFARRQGTLHLQDDIGIAQAVGLVDGDAGAGGGIGAVGNGRAGAGAGLDHDFGAERHQLLHGVRGHRHARLVRPALPGYADLHERSGSAGPLLGGRTMPDRPGKLKAAILRDL
jgi:hypothetical protein